MLRTGVVMYNTRAEIDRLLQGLAEIAKTAAVATVADTAS